MKFKKSLIFAMLIVAIIAVGSVSASDDAIISDAIDDVPVDDIIIDEVSTGDAVEIEELEEVDEVEDELATSYDIAAGSNSSYINSKIVEKYNNGGGSLTFEPGNYTDIALTLKSGVSLIGNGANITGTGSSNVIIVTDASNYEITGFTINTNGKVGIYGSNTTNAVISGNTMTGGQDGVSFFKFYDNVIIENNIISDMTRDGISLANPQGTAKYYAGTLVGATVRNNNISNSKYGIFVGGAFKGNISGNRINNCTCGMQFIGKPNNESGVLDANVISNVIINATTGIEMFHPNIVYFNLTSNNVTVKNASYYAIQTNTFFDDESDGIYVYYNNFTGLISSDFSGAVPSNHKAGNVGF